MIPERDAVLTATTITASQKSHDNVEDASTPTCGLDVSKNRRVRSLSQSILRGYAAR